jgi:outer membrane protein TolC
VSDQNLTTAKLSNQFNASVSASVGFNQTAPVFAQAYQSPLAKQQFSMYVTLPMLQWGAGAGDVQAAKADQKQAAANNKMRHDALAEDARFSVLQLAEAARSVTISAKADTVAEKRFDVAKERYVIGKITNTELYTGQTEKDAAVLAYVQALRGYWVAYYHLRRVSLYDFRAEKPLE